MANTLQGTYVVNGHIYSAGTAEDTIDKDDLALLQEKKAFGDVVLPDHGSVSLDDQEQEALERRGIVDRPPSQLPGTFMAGGEPDSDADGDAGLAGGDGSGQGESDSGKPKRTR